MRLIFILPIGMFVLIAGFLGWALLLNRDPATLPSMLIDKPPPQMALPPLLDYKPGIDTAKLGDGKKVVLVNIFASWCPPCQVEHPVLLKLSRDANWQSQIEIVGIDYKDKPEDALTWLSRNGNPYAAIGADQDGRVSIDWGVYGVPESYLIDRKGRIRYKHVGPLTPQVVEEQILPMVKHLRQG